MDFKPNKLITSDSVLFFDMDGTLVDTNYANFLSYREAVKLVRGKDFNIAYSPHQRFNRSFLKKTISNLIKTELELIVREKEKNYNSLLHETKLNNEIVEILHKYFNTNKTILVTNCRKERALATLNYHGLIDKFSNFFFRQFSDNGNRKINKFQNAILKLGISPNLVVLFENEEIEIINAKQAGIEIINPITI
ncbi:HAD family phosphatase [Apibacter muscae]|uniref:phosphoglycolate phosphatase n=1 Tax=Apibacter muscae TaxID=2509004 RepID=A0A563DBT7_9FLAO|nr:HAD hydrolase-like protein [Apibacter muscae]TWP27778.1 HAD family phosphatase [Apibacter muscae]